MCLIRKVIELLIHAVFIIVVLGLLMTSRLLHAGQPDDLPRVIPSQYIVVFKDTVDTDTAANELAGRFNMSVLFRYRHALRGMAVKMPPKLLDKLSADPRVAYIEQDVIVSINAQTLSTGVDRINADLDPVANIDNVDDRVDVDIAILDTGIDLDHPDLNLFQYTYCKEKWRGQKFIGYECVDSDPGTEDGNSHGTHVAGIAAALDNNSGVVGVAPGARIWAVKVLEDDGNGAGSQIVAGVDYVVLHANEIEVANMSLTGTGSFQPLDDAIDGAVAVGVVITLAAGNNHKDVSGYFPAGHSNAITVSALEDYDGKPGGLHSNAEDDTFASFSNYGAGVDIMAPGKKIHSTLPDAAYGNKNGTSMASPHVAGAAALYLSVNTGATPAAVKTALLLAGDPAPCVNNPDGTCAGASDDPDGIQEPLLFLGCPNFDGDDICDVDDVDDDNDGLSDTGEVALGTDSLDADTDNDGLSDGDEVDDIGTDPLLADTDGDGLSDGYEVNTYGTDPLASNRADLAPRGMPDGVVDAADYLVLIRLVTGAITATTDEITLGDLNDSGGLDVGDMVLMLRVVNGEIPVP